MNRLSADIHQLTLHHALSGLASSSSAGLKERSLVSGLFLKRPTQRDPEVDFSHKFSHQVQWIVSLLDKTNASSRASDFIQSRFIAAQISKCISVFDQYRSSWPVNQQMAQSVCLLAEELKRHASIRKSVWSALPIEQQALLHRLTPWSADLNMLSTTLAFQWLEEGNLDRALDSDSIAALEKGKLFCVKAPVRCEGKTFFPLLQFPDFYLEKASSDAAPSSFMQSMGRIHEVFSIVQELIGKVKEEGEKSALYSYQLRTLFSSYRAALCETLGLSVALPEAIGKQGEWTIWPANKTSFLQGAPLTEKQMKDLHRFFLLEKLLKINLLGDEERPFKNNWVICDGRLLQDGLLPLPTFIQGDLERRHRTFLAQFKFNGESQKIWNDLEEASKCEMDRLLSADGTAETLVKQLLALRNEASPADMTGINEQLQALLHHAMTERSSQKFLAAFQTILNGV